jgi:hypothetical protein
VANDAVVLVYNIYINCLITIKFRPPWNTFITSSAGDSQTTPLRQSGDLRQPVQPISPARLKRRQDEAAGDSYP